MHQLVVRQCFAYGIVLAYLCLFASPKGQAQGCSDAGFCTLHPLKPTNQSDSTLLEKNQLVVGFSHGLGDFGILVSTPYVEYTRAVNDRLSLSAKMGYLFANGEWSTNGFSDVYLNGSYAFSKGLKGVIGLKIPLNDGNIQVNGYPLPMNYQTSLGTFDAIAGLSYSPLKNLGLTIAMQQPLTQNNNQYQNKGDAKAYSTTNGYHRKGDALFRVNYRMELIKDKLETTIGVLPIYHLGNDSYVDESGQRVAITGSEGLTLNGNLFLLYHINRKEALELNFGTPFIARKVRPDGLTRKYVVGIEYKISF